MRATLLLFCLLALGGTSWSAPRLLVVISVDQMRAEFMERFYAKFDGGFKTLHDQGAVLTDAHHPHIPTHTGPGHAAIMTGRYPNETGIVGNAWWDRIAGRKVKVSDDSVFGKGPEQLLTYTLGDALKAKDPKALVAAFSVKARPAVMMGGKKADLAVWFDRKKGRFVTSAYYGQTPAWLDAFNAELVKKGGRLAGLSKKDIKKVSLTPLVDRLLLDLVERALREMPLGEDNIPDILAIGFSGPDFVGHTYGPYSRQLEKQILALDKGVGELIAIIESKVPRRDLAVVLTGDHGAAPVPEGKMGRKRKGKRVKKKAFAAAVESGLQRLHPAPGEKWLVQEVFPHLYLNRELAVEQGLRWEVFLEEAAGLVGKLEGVAHVYIAGRFDDADPYQEVYRRSYHAGRSGDLVVRAKKYHYHTNKKKGTGHGTPYAYDTHVPLIFWGGDFKMGFFSEKAKITDMAPTLGAWLGVEYPPAKGSKIRREVFKAF